MLLTGIYLNTASASEDRALHVRTGEVEVDEADTSNARLPPDIEVLTERGEFQLSLGLAYTRSERLENLRRNRGRAIGLPISLSLGLGRGFEISVGSSANYGENETLLLDGLNRNSETKFDDLSLRLSYQLRDQSARSPSMSVSLNVGVPIEHRSGDKGGTSIGLNFAFSRRVDPLLLFWSIGYSRALEDGESEGARTRAGDRFPYGFGFSFVVNNAISIDTRFNASFSRPMKIEGITLEGSGSEPMYLATALNYRSREGRQWQVALTTGLNDDAGDVEIGLTHLISF